MTSQPPPRGIDAIDHAMLTLALRWLPFGGAPLDEVFVEFGLTADEYTRRIADLVSQHHPLINPEAVKRLRATSGTGCHLVQAPDASADASGA